MQPPLNKILIRPRDPHNLLRNIQHRRVRLQRPENLLRPLDPRILRPIRAMPVPVQLRLPPLHPLDHRRHKLHAPHIPHVLVRHLRRAEMQRAVPRRQRGDQPGYGVRERGRGQQQRERRVRGAGVEPERPGVLQRAHVRRVGFPRARVDVAHHEEEVGEEGGVRVGGGEGPVRAVAGRQRDADGVGGDGAHDGFIDHAHVAVVDIAAHGGWYAFGDGAEVGGEAGDYHQHWCRFSSVRWGQRRGSGSRG